MPNSENTILSVNNLKVHFPGKRKFGQPQRWIRAVDGINFDVKEGETLGLVGESGCGKSTTARAILNLIHRGKIQGTIHLNGTRIDNLSDRAMIPHRLTAQMVFQDPFASLNSVHTVFHHLSRPLKRQGLKDQDEITKNIIQNLEEVGLKPGQDFSKKFPHEMSGGERQRVAIARALCINPDIIIADEPTSMLDVSIRMEILEIFARLRIQKNLTIVFITHDLASARYLADRILVLNKGIIVEENAAEDLIKSPKNEYTKELVLAASSGRLKNIQTK